jgi:hypothetical protein
VVVGPKRINLLLPKLIKFLFTKDEFVFSQPLKVSSGISCPEEKIGGITPIG